MPNMLCVRHLSPTLDQKGKPNPLDPHEYLLQSPLEGKPRETK